MCVYQSYNKHAYGDCQFPFYNLSSFFNIRTHNILTYHTMYQLNELLIGLYRINNIR